MGRKPDRIRVPNELRDLGLPRTLPPDVLQTIERNRYLPISAVAEMLGVPLWTAREWARRGIFPTVVIARRRFVRKRTFLRWLKEREHGGRDA